MNFSTDVLDKMKKIALVFSGPCLYISFTIISYSIYKHYTNYRNVNIQEKIIGFYFLF